MPTKVGRKAKWGNTNPRWLYALSFAITLAFCTTCAAVLFEMRRSDWQKASTTGTNLSTAVESEIARNFEVYDLSLQAVVDGMRMPEVVNLDKKIRQMVLFDRAATAKHLGSIRVLDADGVVILDSRSENPKHENLSNRESFLVHRNEMSEGVHISHPFVEADGEYVIGVSRRIDAADGSFGGVVLGVMRLGYFRQLFNGVVLRDDDVMTLLMGDGTILMRSPFKMENIGHRISVPGSANGNAQQVFASRVDKIERLYTTKLVGNSPLVMSVGLSMKGIYADWWTEAGRIGTVIAALCLAQIMFSGFLAYQLRCRARAERELDVLAHTDGLTQLANRRTFDERLVLEWRRAIRERRPISLMMIDADRFKSYNDIHGHVAGDHLLQRIAGCIGGKAQRASDLAARYGGEEFAVLLPGVDQAAAFALAEEIRSSVNAMQPENSDAPSATISIGVGSVMPQHGLSPEQFVRDTDLALYAAKNNGRNRTECTPFAIAPSTTKKNWKSAA